MTSRLETRFGAIPALGIEYTQIAGPVPVGHRWNLNAHIANRTGGAANCRLMICNSQFPVAPDVMQSAVMPTMPSNIRALAWSSKDILVNSSATASAAMQWSRWAGGVPSAWANFGPAPASNWVAMAWSPDGNWLAAVQNTATLYVFDFRRGYPASTYFTQAITGNGNAVEWSADSTTIFVGTTTAPYVYAWPWNAAAQTFGSVVNAPTPGASLASGTLHMSPDGTKLLAVMAGAPYMAIIPWTGSAWGTVHTGLAGAFTTAVDAVWDDTSSYVFQNGSSTPWLKAWPISASSWGAAISAPTTGNTPTAVGGIGWDRQTKTLLGYFTWSTTYAVWGYSFVNGAFGPYTLSSQFTGALATAQEASGSSSYWAPRPGGGQFLIQLAATPYGATISTKRLPQAGLDLVAAIVFDDSVAASGGYRKISGEVMNAGEVLVAYSSVAGALDIIASGVDITL